MKILIDNGHGSNTPGKCSPDKRLREYAYAREIASRVVSALRARGYDAQRLVTETEDVSLRERCRRVNLLCKSVGAKNVLLVSIHNNAADHGKWMSARGWSAHVGLNASTASKTFARSLIKAAEAQGLKIRRYAGEDKPYWPQNLAICRDTLCPAVLTENLFQDNEEDVAFLLSEEGKQAITALHVNGIIDYIS